MKILIVDDDKEYGAGVSSILEMEGYVPLFAENGHRAIQLLQAHHPDILIIDWQMPEMSGLDLLKYIRSEPDHKQKYTIMISGKNALDDKVTGMDAGADDYLTKPFQAEELLARIRAAVRLLTLQKEKIKQERINTVFEMALSVADKIGNPIAAARMLQEHIRANIHDAAKIADSVEDLGNVLIEAQNLLKKYQSMKNPKSSQSPLGRMIDPENE